MPCPECNSNISDKAVSCPICGYPINLSALTETSLKTASTRVKRATYRRLPNGFGSIRKFSGNRRKKFGAYPPVKEWKDNGTAVTPPAIGYFETYNEAYTALAEYNKNPYDIDRRGTTFAKVYEYFFEYKFGGKKEYSESSKKILIAAYKHCADLYDKPFASIRTHEFQAVIDKCELKTATVEAIVLLIKQMGTYAMQNDITEKNYAQYVKVNRENDDESGVPFTDEELKILWEHKDDKFVQTILVLIYSGWRINEMLSANFDFENHVMVGGLKNKSSKNRTVPMHNDIYDYCRSVVELKVKGTQYNHLFKAKLKELEIATSVKGTVHTPHDCRHTFSWLCDKYKVDDMCKRMIMGHSLGKDVESNVYGHRTVEELKTEINKIKTGRN